MPVDNDEAKGLGGERTSLAIRGPGADSDLAKEIREILSSATPGQIRWTLARLFSKTDGEAARKVGYSPRTVKAWKNKQELDRAIHLLWLSVAQTTHLILAYAAPVAAQVLADSLGARDSRTRISAATAILDRAGIGPKQKHEITGEPIVFQVVTRSEDEENH